MLKSVRAFRCAYVERHHLARLPRVRPIESAMTIDKCDIDASMIGAYFLYDWDVYYERGRKPKCPWLAGSVAPLARP